MKKDKKKENLVTPDEKSNKLVKIKESKPDKLKWIGNIFLILILIVIIIAGYLFINWGIKKLDISDIDLTKEKIYSITQQTKDKLRNLSKDVTINFVNMKEYTSVVDFANKYSKLNDHIKIEQIDDVSTRPDWTNTYGLTSDSQVMIFKCGDKEKIVTVYDLTTYDSTTYKTIDKTEETMTNAILDVTVEEKPKVYFLTGHNNYSDTSLAYLQGLIMQEANEVENLNIMTKTKMPDDCDLLVITTLSEDIKDLERDEIIKYIKNGGNILLLSDPNVNNLKLPNFQKVLDEYGINIGNGIIIETDANKMITGAPNFIINTVTQDSSITKNTSMNVNACFINAGKIEPDTTERMEELGVEIEFLTSATSSAFYRTNLNITSATKTDSDQDLDAPNTGAVLTKKIDDKLNSKMVVFANGLFATSSQIQITEQYYVYAIELSNNKDILLNSVSYLTEREDNITIRKNVEAVTYTVTEQEHRVILIAIFAIPILIILIGIVVWQVRRRKK